MAAAALSSAAAGGGCALPGLRHLCLRAYSPVNLTPASVAALAAAVLPALPSLTLHVQFLFDEDPDDDEPDAVTLAAHDRAAAAGAGLPERLRARLKVGRTNESSTCEWRALVVPSMEEGDAP